MIFPTAHALLIAPGTYAHAPQFTVPINAADANAVAAVLRDPQCVCARTACWQSWALSARPAHHPKAIAKSQ